MYKSLLVLVCVFLLGSYSAQTADFTSIDFPNVAAGTTTQIDASSFDIQGSGDDLWNGADSGHYVYQSISGDFQLTAQVSSLQQTDPWSKAAVMVRASTSPDSINVAMLVSGANGFSFQYRNGTGGDSSWTGGGANSLPNSWIRIIRTGNIVTGLESSDAVRWHIVSSVSLNLPQTIVAGMAVTSHNPSLLCLAQFRNVELIPNSTPGPVNGFTSQDINTYYAGTTVALGADSLSLTGGGNDQWGNADGIRLAYVSQNGDFDFRCKILSLDNIDSWSKAGLTVRQSTDPSSPHASILATPGNGLVFQNRDAFGGETNSAYLGSVTFGQTWIRLIKYQNTVTAYRSDDNIVWEQAAQIQWNDASPVLTGMVVTAHNDSALCTAQFGNVLLQPYSMPAAGSGDGLTAAYFNTNDLSGLPALTQVDATVDHNYGGGTPAPGVNSTNFSVRWTGQVQTQYSETYSFYTVSDDGIRLWVNGNLLIDNWTYHSSTENRADIALLAGNKYDIAIEYFQGYGGSVAQLLWSSPSTPKEVIPQSQLYSTGNTRVGSGTGLLAQYFNAPDLSSPVAPFNVPVLTRVDPGVDFDWSVNSPDPAVNQTNFSVRWIGQIQAQDDDTYTFYATADDGVRLWINNTLLVDGWVDQAATTYTGSIALKAGEKAGIKMEYYQRYGGAVAKLEWSSPSRPRIAVPASQLYSDSGIAVPIPAVSVVSPAFIEGISWAPDGNPYTITASSSGGSVSGTMISDNNWFANVPLNPDGSATLVTATQSSTSGTATGSIVWWPLDLAGSDASDHNIVIRKGDSLLLTANGNGESLLIDADGDGVVDFAGVPGQKLPFQYNVAGTFVAQAKIDDVLAGTLVVTVMDADMTTRVADEVDFQRKYSVAVAPDVAAKNIVVEPADPVSLQIGATDNTLNPVSVSLSALKRGMPTLVARLNAGGPIIAAKRVNEFTLDSQALRGALINLATNTGGTILNMRPYIPNIRIEFDLFAHTSTFAGGATSLSFNTSDIDPTTDRPLMKQVYDPATNEYIGQYFLELDVPPGETKYCFNIHAFDEAGGGSGTGAAVSRDAGSSGGGQIIAQNTNLNGCTCKGSVSPVTVCVNETGSFEVGLALDDPTTSGNCSGPFLINVQSTGVTFTDPGEDRTMYCGETESFEIEGLQYGTYPVTVGGVDFPESVTVLEVDISPSPSIAVTACTDSPVTFNATAYPDQSAGTLTWSAPEGSPQTGDASEFTTTFSSRGDKTVSVTFTANGHSCTTTVTVHVILLKIMGNPTVCMNDPATFNTVHEPGQVNWTNGGDPDSGTGDQFTTKWDSTGSKSVTATITTTDGYSCSKQQPITVVKVDRIQYRNKKGVFVDVPAVLYVCSGDTVDFKAIPDPADASFPAQSPVWDGTSGASGNCRKLPSLLIRLVFRL